jgi:tetratricopeptide (TPR) repeat protein
MLSENPPDGQLRQALNQNGGRAPQPGRPSGGGGANGAIPGGVVGILHVIGGNDRGKAHPLNRPQTTIGRGADQDCILADIAVSRRHIIIQIDGQRYRMKDLGSGNGSLLNGVRTDTALLNDGDQIEIGNTLLRLEHAPSRQQAAAPQAMGGVPRADSGASTMMADASQIPQLQQQMQQPRPAPMPQPVNNYPPPQPMTDFPPAQPMGATPSDAIAMPPAARPISSSLPAPVHTGARPSPSGGVLDSPVKKIAVFGTIGLVVLLAGALVVKKVFFNGAAEAQKLYIAGTKAYGEGDYEQAKKLFSEAHDLVPDSPKTAEYLRQCDMELRAKGALKTAKGLADAKKWEDALAALDKIDQSSALFEDAAKLKKAIVPPAVAAYVAEAKDAMDEDPDTAQTKLEAALTLDPDSQDAQDLVKKLKASGKATRPIKIASNSHSSGEHHSSHSSGSSDPKPVAHNDPKPDKTPPTGKPDKKPAGSKTVDDDDDLAPVSAGSNPGGAMNTVSGDVLASKTAAGPYKAKDFAGAATALRLQAKNEKGKNAEKSIAIAAQVAQLGNLYNKAEADKLKNIPVAVSEYQQAGAIDARIGRNTHAAYFKLQIGKLAKQSAQQLFAAGKYPEAFEASKNAARAGSDDGGVGKQLSAKAVELNNKAAGMQKSNLNGAKTLWRQVVKMVPSSDPAYIKAYQSLNAAVGAHTDDDE